MLHDMIPTQTAAFPLDDTCHLIGEDEDVRAYWIETSGCVAFIDIETGFRVPGAMRICKTLDEAKEYAETQIS